MTTTLDKARDTLTWAANRLTEAHRDIDLPDSAFTEVLDTYLLATRAYHQTIRDTTQEIRHEHHPQANKTPNPR